MRHVNIVFNPRYPDIAELAEEIARDGVPHQAQTIYDGRNRLYRLAFESREVCIKAFHRPAGVNAWVYGNLRHGKARRSYENAMELRRTRLPLSYSAGLCRIRYGRRFDLSYYIYEYISDAVYLRGWEKRPDAKPLADALAAEMARMHAAGIFHKDFTPGNIFFKRDSAGEIRIFINRHQPHGLRRDRPPAYAPHSAASPSTATCCAIWRAHMPARLI